MKKEDMTQKNFTSNFTPYIPPGLLKSTSVQKEKAQKVHLPPSP